MGKAPFYANGLKFSCKRCSSCCRHDAGFVYLTEKDVKNLQNRLNTDRGALLKTYCRWVSNWKGDGILSLKEKPDNDCIFWDEGCTVYKARPFQCIAFPFWDSVMSSKKAWEITAQGCPGMNTGVLHSREEIEKFLECEPIIKKGEGDKL